MSFPKYPEYKESGVKWLGVVPSHWSIKKLKQICEVFPSNVDKKSYDDEIKVYLCNYTDVYYNEKIIDGMKFMLATASQDQINKFTLRKGDTIITKDSETADDIGIPAYVPDDLPNVVCGYHLSIVRPKHTIVGHFVKYLFNSKFLKSNLEVSANGLTRVGLGQYSLDNLVIPVPSEIEQKLIANFLDQETEKIDALIADQEKLINLLQEKTHSMVLSSFIEKDTVMMRLFHASDLIQRPVLQKTGEMYEPLGLYNRGRGLFHKELRTMDEMGDSDFFWVKSGDLIFSGQFAWEGSVAMAYEGEENCVVSHRYPVIRGKSGVVLSEYLFALFTTSHGDFLLNECSIGAAGRNRPLNMNLLLKEKIPIPNLATQNRIAKMVRQRRDLLVEVLRQRTLLMEHRSSLISLAVTGQMDLRQFSATKRCYEPT